MQTRNTVLESSEDLSLQVQTALSESELARAVGTVQRDQGLALALGTTKVRPLMPEEITRLEQGGNTCEDWSRVRVSDGFDWRRIRNTEFHGDVVLGSSRRYVRLAPGLEVATGIQNSTVADCVIGHNVVIRDVQLLANYVVAENVVLWNCGTILCEGETTFGNGLPLPLGIESGGREVPAYAELTVAVADGLTRGPTRRLALARCEKLIEDHVGQLRCSKGIIERGATIRGTARVRNTYVGRNAHIENAALIDESTLLSNAEEPVKVLAGAVVTQSLLQWGARADTAAFVERSVLTEHAYAEQGCKVSTSLLGPSTGIARGEVTASLVGPLVGFHHDALLIATLWPGGKGNIGAGVLAGCNHTSRAPDQEFWCAEGIYFGLGARVMFPCNLSGSPYSVLGCGITLPSQKVAFPFSLMVAPSDRLEGTPPGCNEILPGWMLTENLYALKRNEIKFKTRVPGAEIGTPLEVFRPETIDLVRDACRRLEAVDHVRDHYTSRDIAGLGKNYLTEANRLRTIAAYRFCTRYYALLGLLAEAEEVLEYAGPAEAKRLLTATASRPRWEYQRQILCEELGHHRVAAALGELEGMLEAVARDVERSRSKDDLRGGQIIPDYAEVHLSADKDAVVRQVWKEAQQMQVRLRNILLGLEARVVEKPAGPKPAWVGANFAVANGRQEQGVVSNP